MKPISLNTFLCFVRVGRPLESMNERRTGLGHTPSGERGLVLRVTEVSPSRLAAHWLAPSIEKSHSPEERELASYQHIHLP